jgi:hypothetical protein
MDPLIKKVLAVSKTFLKIFFFLLVTLPWPIPHYLILFSELLKFSKIISSKSKKIVKENNGYLGIFHLFK